MTTQRATFANCAYQVTRVTLQMDHLLVVDLDRLIRGNATIATKTDRLVAMTAVVNARYYLNLFCKKKRD